MTKLEQLRAVGGLHQKIVDDGRDDPGSCVNCGRPNTQSRPIKFSGYQGTEYYCAICPPEKWSRVSVQPTSRRTKRQWNEIMNAVKDGRLS